MGNWKNHSSINARKLRTSKNSQHGATRSKTNDFRSKLACLLEASESARMRMEESLPKHHEDHAAGKEDNSLQHYNLVRKFIPTLQAMKIPAAKPAEDQEWDKLGKDSGVEHNRSQKQTRGDRWSKDEAHKSSFCLTDGHLSFEECRIGDKAPKIQRSSCTPSRHCERWFWIILSIHKTRIISIASDGCKK